MKPCKNATTNLSIGYISGPLEFRCVENPEIRDGGAFYAVVIKGSTVRGERFHVSFFSENPLEFNPLEVEPLATREDFPMYNEMFPL